MTRFIDIYTLGKMVKKVGVSTFIHHLTEYMEQDFRDWKNFEISARLASHTDIGVIELMPVSDSQLYGFKYVNGHPANVRQGLPTVMAFGALADVSTGYPLLLSELTLSTAFRTAAASVLAASYLCRKSSHRMGIIGCGAQSEFQAIAFHTRFGINEIQVFDIDSKAMDKFKNNLSVYPFLKIKATSSVSEAVKSADIITTITASKTHANIITPDMLEPGMHFNAIGGDCPGKTEIHADVLPSCRIVVEYETQTRLEGEIQQLPDLPVTELWQVIRGNAPGREQDEQVTLFDSVGFALEDFSILRLIYDLSQQLGMGQDIQLVPKLDDPRDLFQLALSRHKQSVKHDAA